MHRLPLTCVAAACLAALSTAQTLRHVRLDTPAAETLAASFEAAGYDVVEGSVEAASLELVVTAAELVDLRALGFEPVLLQVGRPFREMQQEGGGVPGYPDLGSVLAQMQAAAASFPSICRFVDLTARYGLPATHEGNSLYAVKISDAPDVEEDEPALLIVGAHHCRETVTPVICLDAIERLTTQYGSDPDVTAAVDGYEIWIAPVWNPDGYEYVFDVDNLWRKNRRPVGGGVGIDLNRNYPFGWTSACSGSTNPASCTYKGPSPASEVETQTMIALSDEQRFAKVMDYHSSGREVLWEYACPTHPLASFFQSTAIRISNQAGYGGANRPPSADGEHYQWQLAAFGSDAYLTETHVAFQPPFASAQAEAAMVWPSILFLFQRPISVSGHVTDACSGQPLEASITFQGFVQPNGETTGSGGLHGRYDLFLPAGPETLTFEADGYEPRSIPIVVPEGSGIVLDVQLDAAPAIALDAGSTRAGRFVDVSAPCPLAGSSFALFGSPGADGRPPLDAGLGGLRRHARGGTAPYLGTLDARGRARVPLPASLAGPLSVAAVVVGPGGALVASEVVRIDD